MMDSFPVIWRVGSSQSALEISTAGCLSITQNLDCIIKVIDAYTRGTTSNEVCSLAEFDDQWQALLARSVPDVIYLQWLPSNQQVVCCVKWLTKIKALLPSVKVILNAELSEQVSSQYFLHELLPYADLVVAARNQLDRLIDGATVESLVTAKQSLAEWLVISAAVWLLTSENGSVWFIDRNHMLDFSMAGCRQNLATNQKNSFALTFVCFLAHGYDELDANTMALAYLASDIDHHAAWPDQVNYLPSILSIQNAYCSNNLESLTFAPIDKQKFGLYPVVDSLEWLTLVLENGVKTAQLRIKNPAQLNLDSQIKDAVALGQQYQAQVFINDYWEKAIEHGAFGIHLGQEDLDIADLATISHAGLALGISTHGYFEIAKALKINPSYIALGHIFPTQTKNMPSQPQGLVRLTHYARLLKGIYPTVAIGGINAERVIPVLKTGVDSVALVSAITKASNPAQATQDLLSLFQSEKEACL